MARLRELVGLEPGLARIVAGRIGLPVDFAEELAEAAVAAGDVATLRALAAHPVTPPERLAVLASHADEGVRRAVALHRATPEAVLRELAGDASAAVRRALAAREKLPKSIAKVLLTDAVGDVRLTLARRVDARPKHLRALADDPDPRVRRFVAALGYLGTTAVADADPKVRRAAVSGCDVEKLAPHLGSVIRDPDPGIRELAAAMGRNHSPESLAVLAADSEAAVRREVAANWFTPESALVTLAGDTDPDVLAAVSGNPFAPPAALEMIVEALPRDFTPFSSLFPSDTGARWWDIFNNLLEHPRISPEALRVLYAKNSDGFHYGNALSQPNWPPDLLIEFALRDCAGVLDSEEESDFHAEIDRARREVALPSVLAMMLRGPVYSLRKGAAANRHTPPEALAEYVRTADPEIDNYLLDDVAKNPATPVEILQEWAAGGRRHYYMLKNPELPESVLRIIAAGDDAEEAHMMLAVRAARAGRETPC